MQGDPWTQLIVAALPGSSSAHPNDASHNLRPGDGLQLALAQAQLVGGEVADVHCCPHLTEIVYLQKPRGSLSDMAGPP